MSGLQLAGKTILVTGAARRVGRLLALACAGAGADVVIHHAHSAGPASELEREIRSIGRLARVLAADLTDAGQARELMARAAGSGPLFALVNSAALFEPLSFEATRPEDWDRHLSLNLTAPFVLSREFAAQVPQGGEGRIVNILDWRALRPGADYVPYTVSKAALAALTKLLAAALAPRITVNGLALGAILPPEGRPADEGRIRGVPLGRWAHVAEVGEALLFLLGGPSYVTGEILHLDGGRHLI